MNLESTPINVLNYGDSPVSVATPNMAAGYWFEPMRDGIPFTIPMTFAEIRLINSQSAIFREGLLRFEPEYEKEIYEKLMIYNWAEILTDAQIKNIILNPNKEGLEKFIKITTLSMFDRVRGMLTQLQNSGLYDISMRVVNVVSERYKELYRNQKVSEIKITSSTSETSKPDVNEIIKFEVERMRDEITKQVRAEFAQKYESHNEKKVEISSKKAGRPTKK